MKKHRGSYSHNGKVGLFLDNKIIPQNSKGEVSETHEDMVVLRWIIDGKNVHTHIPIKLYDELKESKVIEYLENHIEIPPSLFEPGDMVEGCYIKGIVKRKEYSGIDKAWWYNILSADGVLDEDYDIRYEREREDYLKPADNITGECYFKGKDFTVVIPSNNKE
jgi:hypothetical protein